MWHVAKHPHLQASQQDTLTCHNGCILMHVCVRLPAGGPHAAHQLPPADHRNTPAGTLSGHGRAQVLCGPLCFLPYLTDLCCA